MSQYIQELTIRSSFPVQQFPEMLPYYEGNFCCLKYISEWQKWKVGMA